MSVDISDKLSKSKYYIFSYLISSDRNKKGESC